MFQDENFFNNWSSFGRFCFKHTFFARSASDLIQAVFHFHKVKESMLMYCPVWVFFWKIIQPVGHISKSKKCSISFSNLSTLSLRFLSNPLNAFNTLSKSWGLTLFIYNVLNIKAVFCQVSRISFFRTFFYKVVLISFCL